jgi:hypothetical protein
MSELDIDDIFAQIEKAKAQLQKQKEAKLAEVAAIDEKLARLNGVGGAAKMKGGRPKGSINKGKKEEA